MFNTKEVYSNSGTSLNVVASGQTGDIDVSLFERLTLDIVVPALTGGTTPTVTFFLERKDLFGNYTAIYSPAAVPAAGGSISQDMGPGLQTTRMPGTKLRLRWVTAGAPTAATAQVTMLGDVDG